MIACIAATLQDDDGRSGMDPQGATLVMEDANDGCVMCPTRDREMTVTVITYYGAVSAHLRCLNARAQERAPGSPGRPQ